MNDLKLYTLKLNAFILNDAFGINVYLRIVITMFWFTICYMYKSEGFKILEFKIKHNNIFNIRHNRNKTFFFLNNSFGSTIYCLKIKDIKNLKNITKHDNINIFIHVVLRVNENLKKSIMIVKKKLFRFIE